MHVDMCILLTNVYKLYNILPLYIAGVAEHAMVLKVNATELHAVHFLYHVVLYCVVVYVYIMLS